MDDLTISTIARPAKKPWESEPNYADWIDSDTGFNCVIVREEHDALCGFVCIDRSHPFYGRRSDGKPGKHTPMAKNEKAAQEAFFAIVVHGGITYGEPFLISSNASVVNIASWWLGFNCSHIGDYVPSYLEMIDIVPPDDELTAEDIEEIRQSILQDTTPESAYKTFSFVETQCRQLAKQLKANSALF